MKHQPRQAMTLVEVTIGFAILTTITIFFINFLTSSSKEMAFSADHFNAVVLSQKISEDILEEMALNPYGLETLGIDESIKSRHDVVDGSSIFFSFIEDRTEPWGLIEPTKDGMINNAMQPLYDSVKKYKFGVAGKRLAKTGDHEDRNLVACNIDFSWKAQTGKGSFGSSFQLFSPTAAKKVALGATFNEAEIDARIPTEVYRRPVQTIGELATKIGENVDTILAVGRISIVSGDFINSQSFRDSKEKIKALLLKSSALAPDDTAALFTIRLELAKTWYELAKVCFQMVSYLEPHFATLQLQGKFDGSSGSGFNPISFQQDLMNFRIIYEYFAGAIIQARYYYYLLLMPDMVALKGAKAQLQIIQKLINIYRVTSILPNRPEGMSEYRSFLQRVHGMSVNRNPFLNRMISYELKLVDNRNDWLQRYPNLARIDALVTGKLPGILAFIKARTIGMLTN